MNIETLARSAYSDAMAPTKTGRSTEYQIFAKITHKLSSTSSEGVSGFADLVAAVFENRRLWNVLATDVADSDNGLPATLRAQIFYLAEFTEAHSRKVLAREATTAPLIEVNTAIMRGLRAGAAVPS